MKLSLISPESKAEWERRAGSARGCSAGHSSLKSCSLSADSNYQPRKAGLPVFPISCLYGAMQKMGRAALGKLEGIGGQQQQGSCLPVDLKTIRHLNVLPDQTSWGKSSFPLLLPFHTGAVCPGRCLHQLLLFLCSSRQFSASAALQRERQGVW